MSKAREFKAQIGAALVEVLDDNFQFNAPDLELQRAFSLGTESIIITGANRFSPKIDVELIFGKRFAALASVEKSIGMEPMKTHVRQRSTRGKRMKGLWYWGRYSWQIDINNPPPKLISNLKKLVNGIIYPFFDRFQSLESARDAIASNDPWCIGGLPFWRDVLLIDIALNEVDHFRAWSNQLSLEKRNTANELLLRFEENE